MSKNDALHTEDISGYTLRIYPDPDPINWRNDGEPLGTLFCRHRRYNLGDKGAEDAFIETDEGKRELRADVFVALPVYLYDHGGISIRAGKPFSCPWDSGLVGVIYVTKNKARAEYGSLSDEVREKCVNALTAEVEAYDQYINGEVYGYRVESPDGDVEESCWGFYGDYKAPGGALEEGRAMAEALLKREQTESAKCAAMMAI